ncbi:glycosyltransferase [Carboxylicivirga sp. RSCT41]|uniref:glycosyltransferase n=1 Tax=Carboxylicivirga agarovorans TaxID=3417570 RepID=UPI003D32AEE4
MKVLITNATTEKGGAARATIRNYNALKKAGLDIQLVADRTRPEQTDYISFNHSWLKDKYHRYINRKERAYIHKHVKKGSGYWSLSANNRYNLKKGLLSHNADVIHLNWINDNFLSIGELAQINTPVVWTFHDMWAFTGGCHYTGECLGYLSNCSDCPSVLEGKNKQFTSHLHQKKMEAIHNLDVSVVCPSSWMAEKAKESAIFSQNVRIEVIPNCLDTDVYKPYPVQEKENNKKRVLFGAVNSLDDERKGGKYLLEGLRLLANDESIANEIELMVFGSDKNNELQNLPFPVKFMGFINNEEQLANIYSSADLFVVTSKEDNLPNTILESLACGTPVVAYNRGGIKDMVKHKVNGYLAMPFDSSDFVAGIKHVLFEADQSELLNNCRKLILDNFSELAVAQKHIKLYQEITNK